MTLKRLVFKTGVNKENTRYSTEGGWYDCNLIRFRQGTPEKIGGWQRVSANTYLGICRNLWPWSTLSGVGYIGVGTHLKYYLYFGGNYFDITPIRLTVTLGGNPFSTTSGSPIVVVSHAAHGALNNDFVTFSGASPVGGLTISGEYKITYINANSYSINAGSNAGSTATGGGASVVAAYQINTGYDIASPTYGWGGGTWGSGVWGTSASTLTMLRKYCSQNFGEDLLFGSKNGPIYYWSASGGTGVRGVALSSMAGASDVPLEFGDMIVSDQSRFVLVFGTNDVGSSIFNPMLIRWSDQESAVNWTPLATNQAGGIPLSHGSEIVMAVQVREEILVFTDVTVYGMQYVGPPAVWQVTLLSDNVSIMSDGAAIIANGSICYWMGVDKFYMYNGTVQTLPCDLRQYVFSNINLAQADQVYATTIERFSEVWWFYCSANSTTIDSYVVYNYLEPCWYYGSLGRTCGIDASAANNFPIGATYNQNLVNHEYGVDDNSGATTQPMDSFITSAPMDVDDGDHFSFIWRALPDLNFTGSTTGSPTATMTILPMDGAGTGYTSPGSVAGSNSFPVTRTATIPIEAFTNQVNIRVRARQMVLKIESNTIGVQWQLGFPRIDIRPDGRKT